MLALPRLNITDTCQFVRFIIANSEVMTNSTTRAMLLRFQNGQDVNASVIERGHMVLC